MKMVFTMSERASSLFSSAASQMARAMQGRNGSKELESQFSIGGGGSPIIQESSSNHPLSTLKPPQSPSHSPVNHSFNNLSPKHDDPNTPNAPPIEAEMSEVQRISSIIFGHPVK